MQTTDDPRVRLVESIQGLASALQEQKARFAVRTMEPIVGVPALQHHLLDEFSDLLSIFSMVSEGLRAAADLERALDVFLAPPPFPPSCSDSSNSSEDVRDGVRVITDPKAISLIGTRIELTNRISIHLKSVYEWLYHIDCLLNRKRHKTQSTYTISRALQLELDGHCQFRHKLVTHKEGAKAYLRTMPRMNLQTGSFELAVVPFPLPQAAEERINALFKECAADLAPDEASEDNAYEQSRILYQNLDRLAEHQRNAVKRLIQDYGTVGAQPDALVEYTHKLLEALFGTCT